VRGPTRSQRRFDPLGMGPVGTALVLLVLSLCGATGSERVVCRGPDGHMALELSRGGACIADPSLARGGEPTSWLHSAGDRSPTLDASCCGACDDVALGSGEPMLRKDAAAPEGFASPHPSALSFLQPLSGVRIDRAAHALRDPRLTDSLASIRTIPIRC
jgi:hypothetical protein